jgi:hypothetical protein
MSGGHPNHCVCLEVVQIAQCLYPEPYGGSIEILHNPLKIPGLICATCCLTVPIGRRVVRFSAIAIQIAVQIAIQIETVERDRNRSSIGLVLRNSGDRKSHYSRSGHPDPPPG